MEDCVMVVRIKHFFVISLRGHHYTIVVKKKEITVCFVAAVSNSSAEVLRGQRGP
jgi:hypothetical protein